LKFVFRTMGISTTTCLAAGNTAVGEDFLSISYILGIHYVEVEVTEVVGTALAMVHRAAHIMTENFMSSPWVSCRCRGCRRRRRCRQECRMLFVSPGDNKTFIHLMAFPAILPSSIRI
jgi:hypothetical protein